jgi:hypothetical protein
LAPNDHTIGRRRRVALGLGVIATSLLIATAIVGVGFAGGSISAAQYQYGKMTICHHTHSQSHPWVTITISKAAWPAHQRHGDSPAPCSATQTNPSHGKGKGHGKGHSQGSTTTSTTTSTAPSTTHGQSGDHGNSNGHHK